MKLILQPSAYNAQKKALFDTYYSKLNDMQREAICTVKGPLLVLAGAGSGKTTVLVQRIVHILRYGLACEPVTEPREVPDDFADACGAAAAGERAALGDYLTCFAAGVCPPWAVLAITFTNKAAREIKERLAKALDDATAADAVWAGTFHSVCIRILRSHIGLLGYKSGFSIYDTDDQKKLIVRCMKDLNLDDKKFPPKSMLNLIGRAKDKLMTPADMQAENTADYLWSVAAKVYVRYQEELARANALDFDDIIMLTVRLLEENPDILDYYQHKFKYVCVDEYQDTNFAQFRLTELLAGHWRNIMVVGDDDQSIYSWRGGSNYYLLHFQEMWSNSKIVILPDNFRSVDHILEAANALIANNTNRYRKSLRSHHRATVRPIYRKNVLVDTIRDLVASAERSGYKPGDIAIIARKNKALEKIKKSLDGFYLATSPKTLLIKDEVFIAIRDTFSLYVTNFHDPLALYRQLKRNGYELDIPVERDHMLESFLKYFNLPEPDLYDPDLLEIYEASGSPGIALARTLSSCKKLLYAQDLSDAVRSIYQFLWQKKEHPAVEELCSRIEMRAINTASEFLNHMNAMIEFSDTAEVEYPASPDTITLLTAHKSKGKEFPTVVIYGVEEFEESEEGRNLLYVSMTRAKRNLFLLQGSFSDAPLYPEFKNYVD